MTAPLVPPDLVIPRLPWVPVYADRLWESNFFAVATDAEFKAAFCLWLKSWNQKPPGSLPNDDRLLCRLAELNGNLAKWGKVKRLALRNWILCSDERLYHPVVAELVLEAAKKLKGKQERMANARAARLNYKPKHKPNNKAFNVELENLERDSSPSQTKGNPLPLTPSPNGKGEARPPSSSLDERGRIAPEAWPAWLEEIYGPAPEGPQRRAAELAARQKQNP